MTVDDERITVAERYARATQSSDLSPTVERRTDADVLMAAGIAASGDPRKILALAIYRLGVTGDRSSLWQIVEECDGWLAGHLSRKGRRPMPKAARRQLIVSVLGWYQNQTCDFCGGTGIAVEEDAGRSVGSICEACHGSCKKPLQREVPPAYELSARWLADQIDQHALLIHKEMAKLLSQRMDLKA